MLYSLPLLHPLFQLYKLVNGTSWIFVITQCKDYGPSDTFNFNSGLTERMYKHVCILRTATSTKIPFLLLIFYIRTRVIKTRASQSFMPTHNFSTIFWTKVFSGYEKQIITKTMKIQCITPIKYWIILSQVCVFLRRFRWIWLKLNFNDFDIFINNMLSLFKLVEFA